MGGENLMMMRFAVCTLQIEEDEMVLACTGKMRNVYNILVSKPEGKGLLGKPRCRWEDNIKMDHRKIVWGCGLDLSAKNRGQSVSYEHLCSVQRQGISLLTHCSGTFSIKILLHGISELAVNKTLSDIAVNIFYTSINET
jgi:hypothetical protein